jgi:hypothetical protein
MAQADPYWRDAIAMIERRYPDSPIYRLHWGNKELGNLATWQLGNLATWQLGNLATWQP